MTTNSQPSFARPRLVAVLAATLLATAVGSALAGYEYRIPVSGLRATQASAPGDENGSPAQTGSLHVSTDALRFGVVKSGTTSAPQTVVLTNTGADEPLAVSIATDDASGKYLVTNGCTAALAPAGSCQIDVRFQPADMQSSVGSLTLTVAAQAPLTVALRGEGGKSILSGQTQEGAALTTLTFPDTRTNTTSENRSFALTNAGNLPLTFNAQPLTVAAPFALVSSDCAGVLAPTASCQVTAKFAPTQTGLFSVPLSMVSDAQEVSPVVFEGRGTAPLVHVTPETLDFGTVALNESKTLTATVSHQGVGAATLEFSDVSAPFALSHDCPAQLDNAASCTLTVTFTSSSASAFAQALTVGGGAVVRSLGLQATAVDNSIQGTVESIKDLKEYLRNRHFAYSPVTDSFYIVPSSTSHLYEIPRSTLTKSLLTNSLYVKNSMTADPLRGVVHAYAYSTITTFNLTDKTTTSVSATSNSTVHAISPLGDKIYTFGASEVWSMALDANGQPVPNTKRTASTTGSYRAAAHDGTYLWHAYSASGVGDQLEKRDAHTLQVLATYTPFATYPGVVVDMAAGPDGALYIATSSAIYRLDSASGNAVQIAGSSAGVRTDGTGLGAKFASISGITWAIDRLYVWDGTWLRSVR